MSAHCCCEEMTSNVRAEICVALYSYHARKDTQLSFRKGDVITIMSAKGKWWTGQLRGVTGKIPSNFVSRVTADPDLMTEVQKPTDATDPPPSGSPSTSWTSTSPSLSPSYESANPMEPPPLFCLASESPSQGLAILHCSSEPDSPSNSLLHVPLHQAESVAHLMPVVSNDQLPNITGISVEKLIENMTIPGNTDFVLEFLLTYRSFISPITLIQSLIARYNSTNTIFGVITLWVTSDFDDFLQDKILLDTLMDFLDSIEQCEASSRLKIFIAKKGVLSHPQSSFPWKGGNFTLCSSEAPKGILPKGRIETILDIHPLEAARQLTLMEWEEFRKIKPREFFGLAWQKKDAAIKAPNLCHFITWFNKVGKWVLCSVLESDQGAKQRELTICHFLAIAKECMDLGNLNGMMEITAAVGNSAVMRLKKTWTPLLAEKYREFEGLIDKNFKAVRSMAMNKSPCIPYMGIFLSDLTFIEEGNPDVVPDSPGLINWSKMKMTAKVLKEIQRHQSVPFVLQPVTSVQAFISDIETRPGMTDDDAYERSLELEPKEPDSHRKGSCAKWLHNITRMLWLP
ncbi:cell division control protein [Pelomyxa schiedti]|nr:cell division control protein [Pelomyxa schiedti]